MSNNYNLLDCNKSIMSINKKIITASILATSAVLPISINTVNADSIEYRTITGDSVNFRTGPSTSYSSLGKLNKGYKVEYIGTSGSWVNVKYNGKVGYVHNDYVSSSNISNDNTDNSIKLTKVVTASSLNFRSAPSTSASKLGSISKGTEVGVISENNGWAKISYNGKIGYVSASYLANKSSNNNTDNSIKSTKIVTASSLNFRSAPSTSASKLGSILKGTKVGVISESNGWTKINYNGKIGYVSSAYLSDQESNGTSDNTTSNKVDKVIDFAKTLLGKPYVWGAEGPNSFDCSGFTQYLFKKAAGVSLPRVSKDQAKFGQSVSRNNLQKGDLIAFDMEGSNNGQVNHIGIYMGGDKLIHASSSKKKVLISDMTTYYYNSIVSIRRVL